MSTIDSYLDIGMGNKQGDYLVENLNNAKDLVSEYAILTEEQKKQIEDEYKESLSGRFDYELTLKFLNGLDSNSLMDIFTKILERREDEFKNVDFSSLKENMTFDSNVRQFLRLYKVYIELVEQPKY